LPLMTTICRHLAGGGHPTASDRPTNLSDSTLINSNIGPGNGSGHVAAELRLALRRVEVEVFRITSRHDKGATSLIVEGKLIGACVEELEKCWRAATGAEPYEPISVDLTSVCFIDDSGKQLLTRMHERGTKFIAAGLLAKLLIEEIECAESISTGPTKASYSPE